MYDLGKCLCYLLGIQNIIINYLYYFTLAANLGFQTFWMAGIVAGIYHFPNFYKS